MTSQQADDEVKIPPDATLISDFIHANLALRSTSVSVAPITCVHSNGNKRYLLVGRQAGTADLRIQHKSISRKHAVLFYLQQSLVLTDLGGKHGTTVNGERVNGTVELKDGDTIMFGNVRESVFSVKITPIIKKPDGDKGVQGMTETEETTRDKGTASALEKAGEGLTGRAKRQAEIAAVTASLEETPEYTKFEAPHIDADAPNSEDIADAVKFQVPVRNQFDLESESERRNSSTCIAIDPAGARFVVGTTDNCLRFYDFGGLDRLQAQAFKSIIPEDGYWPVDCCYSNTGDKIIVGTGSVQPIVLDRDGATIIKFVRGDMYVTDQNKTVGHTASVTSVQWHPLERDIVLTASIDGSARIWDLNGKTQFGMLLCGKVFQAKSAKGQRTAVTAVCFHPAGREFVLGTACGSIQVWSRSRASGRPERAVYDAHGNGKAISAVAYNFDGTKIASRSKEEVTVKVWNSQRMSSSSKPLVTCTGAHTVHDQANAVFSPDAKVLCVGVARREQTQDSGALHFYDISGPNETVSPLFSIDLLSVGVVLVKWHSKINQIFVGCSNGQTIIFYDERFSNKGAVTAAAKAGRRVDELSELINARAPKGSAGITGEIVVPLYRDNLGVKRKRKEDPAADALSRREPERPTSGKHKTGSQVGGSVNFQQFVSDQTIGKAREIAGKDPREALFKYNEGKSFVERAYEGNKSKLADKTAEEEEEEAKKKRSS
jgi:WD repeat-containing protein 70